MVDFIWAGLSLPFCSPDKFHGLWNKIVNALNPGGYFAGDFFGPNHVWSENAEMTFLTKDQIHTLFKPLNIEYFIEEEGIRRTALMGMQHCHTFSVIAGKA